MAKRFQFRLEVVRKLRERARDVQRQELARAVRSASEVQSRLGRLRRSLDDVFVETRGVQRQDTLDMPQICAQSRFRSWLRRRMEEAASELVAARQIVVAERKGLSEASCRLKAIENLRHRQWQRHLQILQKEEQAALDEAGTRKIGGDLPHGVQGISFEQELS